MRKVFVFIILLLFNFLFVYGINYANELMFKNDFMIYFKGKPVIISDEEEENKEIIIDTSYDGEKMEDIARKMDKYFEKTPLEGYGEFIAKTSISKGVNPYLIGGIIIDNTSCKNDCSILFKQCNNVGGLKGTPGCFGGTYKEFKNVGDSITELVGEISKRFYTKEMQVPNTMYADYGKNATWAFKVNKIMEKLKTMK